MKHALANAEHARRFAAFGASIVIVLVGLVIIVSRAASSNAVAEAEGGTLSGSAKIITDTNASSSKAIIFQQAAQQTVTPGVAPTPAPAPAPTPTPSSNASYKKLTPNTTWQWQISGTINETILDASSNSKKMFDLDMENTDAAAIGRLKAKGITVICYTEVGAWEDYRSDAGSFPANVKGKPLDPPYQNELYVDIRSQTVFDLVLKRMDRAKSKGCEGIEPDIDDAYFEDFNGNYAKVSSYTGFPISYNDQLNYNKKLAAAAHERGMSYGLKNGADDTYVQDLLPHIDWVLNEQCYQYGECSVYDRVISAGKAVFNVEYSGNTATFCPAQNARNFDSLKKNASLDALPRTPCRGA